PVDAHERGVADEICHAVGYGHGFLLDVWIGGSWMDRRPAMEFASRDPANLRACRPALNDLIRI
ncbi:MAG: hypothetical protein LBI59_03660, partial [Candidatus Accumulibacter sp.]|nr:hypothetical protein [Accumulibacter sp.]